MTLIEAKRIVRVMQPMADEGQITALAYILKREVGK